MSWPNMNNQQPLQQQQGNVNTTNKSVMPIMSPLSPNQLQQHSSNAHIAQQNLVLTSRLLRLTAIDQPYELDKQWSTFLKIVDDVITNCTETEAVNKLHERLGETRNKHAHTEICLGLMFGILIIPDMNKVQLYWRLLNHCVRDGFELCRNQLSRLIHEKFHKILDLPLERVMWILGEFVKMNVNDVETVCTLLLRQIITGDFSQRNIWLTGAILSMLHGNKKWTFTHRRILCSSVYTYLRLIEDQSTLLTKNNSLINLRQREIQFCTEAIRERFFDVITIGRDFARVLYQLSYKHKIPEMESIWKDLILKPQQPPTELQQSQQQLQDVTDDQKLQPYTGLGQIMSMPTRTRFLSIRVSSEMERELSFIMTNVKMGNQRRYQLWFQQKFLNTPESDMLIVDLIRYICCVFHPPNHILAGNFTPRWAMIGWLLKSLKSQQIYENAKFALVFDWLFCNKKENVMNLEPAMLLMVHSVPKYMDITSTILETIFSYLDSNPPYMGVPRETLIQNVQRAAEIVVGSGVVSSFLMLSECPKLEQSLRDRCKKYFPRFTQVASTQQQPIQGSAQSGGHPPINPLKMPNRPTGSPVKAPPTPPINVLPPVQPIVMHKQHAPPPPVPALSQHQIPSISGGSPTGVVKPPFSPINPPQQPQIHPPKPSEELVKVEEISRTTEPPKSEELLEKSIVSEEGSVTSEGLEDEEMRDISDDESDDTVRNLLDSLIQSSVATKSKFSELFESSLKQLGTSTADYLEKKKGAEETCKQILSTIFDVFEKNATITDQTAQQFGAFMAKLLSAEFIATNITSGIDVNSMSIQNDIMEQQTTHMKRALLFADQTIFFFMMEHIFKAVMSVLSNKEEKQGPDATKQVPRRRTPKESKQTKDRLTSFVRYACTTEPSLGYRALCYCIRKLHSKAFEEPFFKVQSTSASSLATTLLNSVNLQHKGAILTFYEWLLHVRKAVDIDKMQNIADTVFISDMRNCIIENPSLFVAILPIVSREMSQHIRRSKFQFYKLLVSNLYPTQLQSVLPLVRTGKVQILFAKQKVKKQTSTPATTTATNSVGNGSKSLIVGEAINIIEKSLQWEDQYDQDTLWELITAELYYQQRVQVQAILRGELESESKLSDNKQQQQTDSKSSSFQTFSISEFVTTLFAIPNFESNGKIYLDKLQRLIVSVATYVNMARESANYEESSQLLDVLNYEAIKTILSLPSIQYHQFPSNLLFEYIQVVGDIVEPIFTHILKLMEDEQQTQVNNRDDTLVHLLNLKQLEVNNNDDFPTSNSDRLFQNHKFMRQVLHLKERWKNRAQQYFILSQLVEGYDFSQKQQQVQRVKQEKMTRAKSAQQKSRLQSLGGTRKSTRQRKARRFPWNDEDEESSGEEDSDPFIVQDDEVDEPAPDSNEDDDNNTSRSNNKEEGNNEEDDEEDDDGGDDDNNDPPSKKRQSSRRTVTRRRRYRRNNVDSDEDPDDNESSTTKNNNNEADEGDDNDRESDSDKEAESEDDEQQRASNRTNTRSKRKRQHQQSDEEEDEEENNTGGIGDDDEEESEEDLEAKFLRDQKARKRRRLRK